MLTVTHVKVVGWVTGSDGVRTQTELDLPLRDFVRMLAIGTETVQVKRAGKVVRERRPAIVVAKGAGR